MVANIWRLENDEGRGVYQCAGDILRDLIFDESSSWEGGPHPAPGVDPLLGWNQIQSRDWFFGFAGLEQYKRWVFTKEARQSLRRHGVRLNRYEVLDDDYRAGLSQAVFKRDRARLVESFAPDQI